MAQHIVDFLEMIEIEQCQRKALTAAHGLLHHLMQTIVEQTPIGQAGQGVVERHVFQLQLALAQLLRRPLVFRYFDTQFGGAFGDAALKEALVLERFRQPLGLLLGDRFKRRSAFARHTDDA